MSMTFSSFRTQIGQGGTGLSPSYAASLVLHLHRPRMFASVPTPLRRRASVAAITRRQSGCPAESGPRHVWAARDRDRISVPEPSPLANAQARHSNVPHWRNTMNTKFRKLIIASASRLHWAPRAASSRKSPMSANASDARLEAQISTTYALSPHLHAGDITVSVQDGKATLTGAVPRTSTGNWRGSSRGTWRGSRNGQPTRDRRGVRLSGG
jgi:hypothetical protein